uniref:Si:dkey-154p10.3 n=1 Tax=Nothobranchius kadleci TaxID=1051664 RepID=A0A1A8CH08_NOTKA|nr:gastrula zinc finger protein XlCGF57.1 isoform X1 [Nothobranchius furzeri]XP_054599954.1 gastrula zinc finger protein XlCGF57.1 isoform X1 [Nothobranchius furzeri]
MSWLKKRYSDISPVTLQVVGGALSSSLYCGEVEGLSLAESFLVELYRCKICQFTCGLRAGISSHLLLRHAPPTLTCLIESDGQEAGLEARLQQTESPYQLDLGGESKQREEDEEFLLYDMLEDMSPPTCDISSEGGLQVSHTCEVSTLFEEEEESSILPLKGGSVDLSCPINPPSTQEEMEQSAHLMTLGLCRISAVKPSGPLPSVEPLLPQLSRTGGQTVTQPPDRHSLLCLLCPLTLPSKRLLDVHVRSHRPAGGFGCPRCRWTADSWEELEHHWRSHSRSGKRRRRREGQEQQGNGKRRSYLKRNRKSELQSACSRSSDMWGGQLFVPAASEEVELPDSPIPSQTSTSQTGSSQNILKAPRMLSRKNSNADSTRGHDLCCSHCHRKFSSKLILKRHLGIHVGEKPFTCPHCSYSSRLKASLLQHLRTHTGERPFRCSECSYASIDRSSLLRHCRTHSQEKPYKCQLCDYCSIQKKGLDLHTRRHHSGLAFPCQQCEYSNPDRQLLLKHICKRHNPSLNTVL